jgi:putative transposase
MRFRFIEDRRADYPVRILCDVLGVSPAGYYAWRSRPESRRSAANRELVDDIKRVHRDAYGRYGSPRIHVELKARGRGVSRGRIERLMRHYGSGPSWRGHGGCGPPTVATSSRLP